MTSLGSRFTKFFAVTPAQFTKLTLCTAVGGVIIGKSMKNVREHPGTVQRILKHSLATGIVTGTCGACFALFKQRKPGVTFLSYNMIGTMTAAFFCNVRSVLSNDNITSPISKQPLNSYSISTISGASTAAFFSLLARRGLVMVVYTSVFGAALGIVGQAVGGVVENKRLEYVIARNYPSLVVKHKQSEDWIQQQTSTNPKYSGPVAARKWYDEWLDWVWGDFRKGEL